MSKKVYKVITDKLMALIEKGTPPWRKPWKGSNIPRNIWGKPYRGTNIWMLLATAMDEGYSSPSWVTKKQAEERGGSIPKNQVWTPVLFWKWLEKEDNGGEKVRIPLARFYQVYNLDQVEGLEDPNKVKDLKEILPIPEMDQLLSKMPDPPTLAHGGNRASYNPVRDHVQLPHMGQFDSSEEYYCAKAHELVHSTAIEKRLNRVHNNEFKPFGTPDYSREELVAEMGAAMILGVLGIEQPVLKNSAAYLAGWLKALENNTNWLIEASQQAQKAVDYIGGIDYKNGGDV
jgi:antirestriction protein ArdC